MPHQKYLLIIDDASEDTRIQDYFTKFDYQIIYYNNLNYLSDDLNPIALLINSSLIAHDTCIINSIYHRYPVPIIIISDIKNEERCVQMLEAGADDFLIKPIHPRELHARISAIGRRVQRSIQHCEQEKEVMIFANWRLYPASRQLFDEKQQELLLSAGEYDLLLAFLHRPQRVLDREFLLQMTKNSDLAPFDRRIDVQISRLRQKIETDAKKPMLIKTIRNGGYLFTSPVLSFKENELTA